MLTWHCWAYFVEVTGRKEMFVHGKENPVCTLKRVFLQYSQKLYTVKC